MEIDIFGKNLYYFYIFALITRLIIKIKKGFEADINLIFNQKLCHFDTYINKKV